MEFMFAQLFCVLLGLATGVLSGTFGLGGGALTTPAMRDVLRTPGHVALGTPLPIVIPTAASGALVFHRRGLLRYRVGLVCALAGSVTAVLAAGATAYFGGRELMLITSAYIAVVAVKFAFGGKGPKPKARVAPQRLMYRAALVGLVAGALSGFLGMGGGIVLVPAMVLLLNFRMHEAVGTSLMVMSIYAIPGSVAHYLLGHVDVALLIPIALGSVLGAQLGARLAVRTRERRLKLSFSAFLFVVAAFMAATELLGWYG
ncbi:MAG: sulfite exporter TauE/SafE family protein [Candidatus Hodarchaeaceae archaeon]|nr:sulfite exporter TauE/SafE family protein [Candidatus Hodarchaeaceae archaeon]